MGLGESVLNPQIGMLAVVRNRQGIVSDVRDHDGASGRLHLIRVEYSDDGQPAAEELLWELEPSRRLLEPSELPRFASPPMAAEDFEAMLRAARWNAISPYLDPDGGGPLERLPLCSPFHGAVEVDDYQLIPLLKALRMPRVNLFIADDVGLGKTIEAGLILSELLIRRRINRVLILTPASLRLQWRDEMWEKFSLPFDVVDRDASTRLKRSLGVDANPWRCSSRIIASYHYLRQPDVLEQFMSACRTTEGTGQLPWDLLIVDEAHNLMPASFGEDSQLCRTLRLVSPLFEHRLFLTATPHNGHTRAFTGLLEMLDPVRFSRTDELKPAEKERIRQVVIRRLKREINQRTDPPKFCTRMPPAALLLDAAFGPGETLLMESFEEFRAKIRSVMAGESKRRRLAGTFAIEILAKRLLSGPMTFLESWRRCKAGMAEEAAAADSDVAAARRTVEEETADDLEAQQRDGAAAAVVGAWLKTFVDDCAQEIDGIDTAAELLEVDLARAIVDQQPSSDARFATLCKLIDERLRDAGGWRDDERLVVFTEYKTTLDYLLARLRRHYRKHDDRFLTLFGGMADPEREAIKDAFNDPAATVRVLIATDAASEGLNLQSTARYLLHYDCPWNPSRLEQRNGRLDRHGQARDVHVFHFASERDADLKFLAYLIGKVDQIREDLGATGELFDEATHRRLVQGDELANVQQSLDRQISRVRGEATVEADNSAGPAAGEERIAERLDALAAEIDYDPETARRTLDTALSIHAGRPQVGEPDALDRFQLLDPSLPGWKDVVDETVRRRTAARGLGPIPRLTFSGRAFMVAVGRREVFRPRLDTLMLHLAHPLMRKATGTLVRRRYPGPQAVSRWCVRTGAVPAGAQALVLLHLEEIGVNDLRETFHHWTATVAMPVARQAIGAPLPHLPARQLADAHPCQDSAGVAAARDLLDAIEPDLQEFVKSWRRQLTGRLRAELKSDGETARRQEDERYQSRQGEVSALIAENTLAKLEKDVARLKAERRQGMLFDNDSYMDRLDRDIQIKQEELERRRTHYEEVREQLSRERERIMNHVLPRRYALKGAAQVFPVALEIRFPEAPHA